MPTGRMELLMQAANADSIHVLGMQEGRWPKEAQFNTSTHCVIASQRGQANEAGCQIWVGMTLPWDGAAGKATVKPIDIVTL
eukprot:9928973-Alexandrium_andersonii.AAC.1